MAKDRCGGQTQSTNGCGRTRATNSPTPKTPKNPPGVGVTAACSGGSLYGGGRVPNDWGTKQSTGGSAGDAPPPACPITSAQMHSDPNTGALHAPSLAYRG